MRAVRAIFLLFLLAAFLAGCASTNVKPHTGGSLALEDDEQRLWVQAEEGERKLARSGLVERDAELEGYMEGVLRSLYPDVPLAFRVRPLKDGSMNAFALPNGAIFVHTGLLAQMENEAQLAALLGHEAAHSVFRHSLKGQRQLMNRSALYAAVTLGGWGGNLFTMVSVTGYQRDLEREADAEGYRRMAAAGYDTAEAPKLFRILERWSAETGNKEPYFFSSHPKIRERIENYEAMIASDPSKKGGADGRDRYLSKTREVVVESAWLDLKAGRFDSALRSADRYLSAYGGGARAHYLRGEVFRQRGSGGDADRASEEFLKAITADASYPDPYRALGLLRYKGSGKEEGRELLQRYLSLAPDAPDRKFIENYLGAVR